MLMSGLVGSLATFFFMTKRFWISGEDYLSLPPSDPTQSTSGEKDAQGAVQQTLN
jgi:hypothetical protein